MSALTDLFTAMANKIRTKTGTQTTYTPSEMVSDGIDDVYDAGVESATTPITPSNASPAPMTSGTGYKPTANGYAISSYETLYPSDVNPQTVENTMAKISGMGTLIQNAPLAITPSSSNPVRMYEDTVYRAGGEGYAIYAYDTLIPQMTPTAISSGHIYKADNNGYAIASYNNVTPSNSSPVSLTSGEIDKMGGNGYAISGYDTINVSSTPKTLYNGDFYKVTGQQQYAVKSINVISPSNANPPAINRYGSYFSDWAGYAIESYDSVTPSSTPESVSSGDIVKIGGSGVIVDAIPTPTSITPSDSSPVALTADTPVNPTASGYAIESYAAVEPSQSPPVLSAGNFYKPINNGYLISNYSAVTPSADGTYFAGGFRKMSSSGYAYSQKPKRVQTGDYTTNYTDPVTVNLDFSPSLVIVYCNINATQYAFVAISENKGEFYGWNMHNNAGAHNIGTFTWNGNSFTHKAYQANMGNRPAHYVAIE